MHYNLVDIYVFLFFLFLVSLQKWLAHFLFISNNGEIHRKTKLSSVLLIRFRFQGYSYICTEGHLNNTLTVPLILFSSSSAPLLFKIVCILSFKQCWILAPFPISYFTPYICINPLFHFIYFISLNNFLLLYLLFIYFISLNNILLLYLLFLLYLLK